MWGAPGSPGNGEKNGRPVEPMALVAAFNEMHNYEAACFLHPMKSSK